MSKPEPSEKAADQSQALVHTPGQEWVAVNLPWDSGDGLDSFCSRKLNKAGVLIRTANGDEWLIGDMNEICGACDHCRMFKKTEIITAYRVVFVPAQAVI